MLIKIQKLKEELEWIRYHIPNKKDLIKRLSDEVIFFKFDLKSGFEKIQLHPEDKYKTAFRIPFGHYEWTVFWIKKCS